MAKTSGLSIDYENKILNHVLRNTALAATTPYMALYTSDPTENDTGTEVIGGGYNRVLITGSIKPFAIRTGFSDYGLAATNASAVTFGVASATWGWITHFGLRTQLTSGNLIFYGPLSSGSVYIQRGDIFSVSQYNMTVALSTNYQYFAYSAYLEEKLLDHILNSVSFTTPGTSVYAALYKTMPDRDDANGVEVSGSVGYSRQACGGTSYWNAPSSGCTTNAQAITMCDKTPVEWGSVAGMGFRSSASGGNLLLSGFHPSDYPITVSAGDGIRFAAGAIKINQWTETV